ncbi:MAG: endolytic transglycosylase MltG [Clostridiales bacterium]|jgi:UPF0755 protein|nr:endolytic transglycosylase MltG [Clostridiales bacterium]
MRQRSVWTIIWNGMSFVMGTSFNWIVIAATIFFIYVFMIQGFRFGEDLAHTTVEPKSEDAIHIAVKEGETGADVASTLEKEGVIPNALLFRLENLLKASNTEYAPGEYTLSAAMDTSEINAILRGQAQSGPDLTIKILEGFSLKNIGDYLESNSMMSAEIFLKGCAEYTSSDYEFLKEIPMRENRLEGFLFPDTYFISSQPTPEEIIEKMLTRFEEIYAKYAEQAANLGLSVDQTIAIASIIEKEIQRADERALASQLIHNRIRQNMSLGMSSTVLYVLGIRKDRLTQEDLQIESPYNTYVYSGLPPGPICNPGERCIEAAVTPAEGNLLYFVLKDEETGAHLFTDSEEEYEQARKDYNQKF